jgi:ribosomal protein S17
MNGWTGEALRWVVSLILAGVVSYFTTIGSMKSEIAIVVERESNHYTELLRRLERIERKLDDQRDYGFRFQGQQP